MKTEAEIQEATRLMTAALGYLKDTKRLAMLTAAAVDVLRWTAGAPDTATESLLKELAQDAKFAKLRAEAKVNRKR